jgi:hypothetical protein
VAATARWTEFENIFAWPKANDEPLRSQGHPALGTNIDVRVTPAARETYLNLVADSEFPDGTSIAQISRDKARNQPIYVLQLRAGIWQFLVLDQRGAIAEQGQIPACVRCHLEAPSSPLFGVPRTAKRESRVAPSE